MKWVKVIITAISTMFLGMWGGQSQKGARRYGISGLAVAMDWKRGWPMILLIPVLVMGYGEKSWIMGVFQSEVLVRIAYAMLLSIPFYFYGLLRGAVASVLLIAAFQIHAGSLGYVPWFGDFLVEDIVRYLTLGILIAFNMFFHD